MKLLITLLVFSYIRVAFSSPVLTFEKSVQSDCKECTSIQTKKIFLFLLRAQNSPNPICKDPQFIKLADSCCKHAISCEDLTQIFNDSMTRGTGNVFGE